MTATALGTILVSLALIAGAQPPAQQSPPPPSPEQTLPIDNLGQRLAQLSPEDPHAYFLLAEEVASEADDPAERDLARHLYVLAQALDRREATARGARATLTPSVCYGLSALADRADERAWLRALARSVDDRWAGPDWSPAAPGAAPQEAAFDLATALGLVRAGEGRLALRLLEQPEVDSLFDEYQGLLDPTGHGLSGGKTRVLRAAENWPACPECRNRRIVSRIIAGEPTETLCYTCRGNPGPRLTEAEFTAQLRMESVLLEGRHTSWSAQAASDGGAPLRDLDPEELAATYNVDVSRPLWRSGRWAAEPE